MMTLLLLGCSDTGLSALTKAPADALPGISVSPTRLDFWGVTSGDATSLPFTVTSVGEASLRVEGVTLSGDGSFTLPDGGASFDLLPGESREISVVFAPLTPGELTAQATVTSDDPDAPEVLVDLLGDGRVPSLAISPESWDFGVLPLGCTDDVALTFQNVGNVDLVVDALDFDAEGLTLAYGTPLPWTLAPYAYETASVTFAPAAPGTVSSLLSVTSNDPRGVVTASQSGEGLDADRGTDVFVTPTDPPVDVLFAIDRSASMDDDAAGLGGAFSSFIDTIDVATSGWRIAVVTTDEGCANGGILTEDTPDLAETFSAAVRYGDERDIVYDEALFQIVDTALRETAAGGCNEGFLRDGALLHVIVVSDEPERSSELASAWTWDFFLPRYEAYVASPSLLEISGIVDTDGCNEGDDGYAQAIAATGGERLSICSGDWASRLATLASASLGYTFTFPLDATPVEASLAVTLDGAPLTGGWRYNATLNAVVLDAAAPGSTVEVTYAIATSCPS
jgi:hypothetical protein